MNIAHLNNFHSNSDRLVIGYQCFLCGTRVTVWRIIHQSTRPRNHFCNLSRLYSKERAAPVQIWKQYSILRLICDSCKSRAWEKDLGIFWSERGIKTYVIDFFVYNYIVLIIPSNNVHLVPIKVCCGPVEGCVYNWIRRSENAGSNVRMLEEKSGIERFSN